MSPLYIEINRWLPLQFTWGENDCMTVLADWIKKNRGVDPMEHVRGKYNSMLSCQRVTGFFSDPVSVMDSFVSKAGLEINEGAPRRGDVGVLLCPSEGKLQPVGGLYLGYNWAVKAPQGATTLRPSQVLASWGMDYED
jgi:hypothetical protein